MSLRLIAFTLVAAVLFNVGDGDEVKLFHEALPSQPPATTLQAVSDDLAALVDQTVKAVVGIRVSLPREWMQQVMPADHPPFPDAYVPASEGSGFFISEAGYLLTCDHVVTPAFEAALSEPMPARRIAVELHDGRHLDALLVGRDDLGDLALLKVESDRPLPFLTLGGSKAARVGEIVLAVGNPFGILANSVSMGILSGRGRSLLQGDLFGGLLQTDATVNVGNSGGPLLNARGEVVGIANAKGGGTGVSFAIPIDEAKRVLPELKKDGAPARGFLGISFSAEAQDGRLTVVRRVIADSPAEKAGVKVGDIVLKVFDAEVDSTQAVTNRIGALRPGDLVRVELQRDGEKLVREITLGRRPKQ
ncbi:MAG: trypsin-like peptidase domain-containing protein [Planctomycetota bacterium]